MKYKEDLLVVLENCLLELERNEIDLDIDEMFLPLFDKLGRKSFINHTIIRSIYNFTDLLFDSKNHNSNELSDHLNYSYNEGIKDLKEIVELLRKSKLNDNNQIILKWKDL